MRTTLLRRVQRIFLLICFLLVLGMAGRLAHAAGFRMGNVVDLSAVGRLVDLSFLKVSRPTVALISGHAGFDSGAICADAAGNPLVTEAETNAEITERVARILRRRRIDVLVLNEYDDRLPTLQADVLLSLHSDSCIDASGYKAAVSEENRLPQQESTLLACIDAEYAAQTELVYHPHTVTHDMLGYYAFNRIPATLPAAILEMGFLGGDQRILTQQPERVAQGVAASLLCYFENLSQLSESES